MEWIGDYYKANANANIRLRGNQYSSFIGHSQKDGIKNSRNASPCFDCFLESDIETARKIIYEDDVVDSYYSNLNEASIQRMIADARMVHRVNYILIIYRFEFIFVT